MELSEGLVKDLHEGVAVEHRVGGEYALEGNEQIGCLVGAHKDFLLVHANHTERHPE